MKLKRFNEFKINESQRSAFGGHLITENDIEKALNLNKWFITHGCGFGEVTEVIDAKSHEEAERTAYLKSVEDYESYEGLHGIRTREEIMEEEGVDEEEADGIYTDERENSLDYSAELYVPEKHDDLL